MDLPGSGRPGDRRNFIHKRLIGAVTGFAGSVLSGGNPFIGAARGFITKGGGGAPPAVPGGNRVILSRVGDTFANIPSKSAGCFPGFHRDPRTGQCVINIGRTAFAPTDIAPGGDPFTQQAFGQAVMGQFGAALEPAVRTMDTRVCPRGTVLGVDGLCYNHRDIKNSERAWPRGRRPLLTGGDMRCISVAASAAKKLERKTKQLQSMGMLKKPASRSRQRALPSGHHAHVQHD